MLEELSKTVKAQLYERVSSPLLGSFLIAWCGWNYKFVLVLISSMDAEKKLAYINAVLYPSIYARLLEGFTYPLLTSLLLIFVYPLPARWIYSYSRRQQVLLKKLQQVIDEETPLSMEDARELRKSNSLIVSEFEQEIAQARLQNDRLKEQLAAAKEALNSDGQNNEGINVLLMQLSELQDYNDKLQIKTKSDQELIYNLKSTIDSLRSPDSVARTNAAAASIRRSLDKVMKMHDNTNNSKS